MYQFIVLDPRKPIVPANTLGIEVTIPEVAALCDLGNIDPQHLGSTTRVRIHDPATSEDKGYRLDPVVWAGHGAIDCGGGPRNCLPLAAIDAVIAWPPPAAPADPGKCVTLATIRPDLDAFGAMAVLALRAAGVDLTADALARVTDVAAADGNTRTTWEPRPLPTAENPWPASPGSIDGIRPLAAIASVCNDRRLSVATRVAIVAAWILGGEDPSAEVVETASQAVFGVSAAESCIDPATTMREARAAVEAERADMIAALADERITISVVLDGDRRDDRSDRLTVGDDGCLWGHFETGSLGYDGSVDYDYRGRPAESGEVQIAIVRSAHRAATMLGQCVAPIAICFHPAFPWPSGEPTTKATIAWAVPPCAEVVQRVQAALNAAEREKVATQIDSVDLGVTYEGGFPGVFFDSRPGRSAVGAATLLRGGHVAAALDVIDNIAPADAARFGKDIAAVKSAIQGAWGGNIVSGILGSPQGRASLLSEDEIVSIVRGAL